MNRAAHAIASLCLLLIALCAHAQPDPANLRGDSSQTRKRLAEAAQKQAGGNHADAADDLQRILDESGDDLISFDGKQYRPARWVAHRLLAQLSPDVLKAYQDRIDQPAKKLLDRAKQTRDPRPLWQLLDRYFVARPADEALRLLGDLLFERGEFRAAETVWRRLIPDAGADIVYPNSKADPALVRARIVLAVIFQHETARAKAEFAAFTAKHATATGTLAGKTGPLADTLKAFLAAPPQIAPDANTSDWPTFGGAPDRSGRVPGGIPQAWPSRPSWVADIVQDNDATPSTLNPPAIRPFGHSIIVNGEVFVADGTRIISFDLHTGKRTKSFLVDNLKVTKNDKTTDACCSLSASGGLLFARFGPSVVRAPNTAIPGRVSDEPLLVCLTSQLKELWRLSPPEGAKVPAAWEGTPLVSAKRLWAVYAKFEGGRVIHVAACYDPIDGDSKPIRPAWVTELCDGTQPISVEGRTRQELLTLAGRHVVFCSNNGAVIALDASTGQRAWGFRYSRTRKASSAASDPAPAVAFGGRVFVAPTDGERVYALDAHTGQLVWETGSTEGARIVGVARNRLVVSVTGPLRGLRGLNLDTGSHRAPDGWVQFNGNGTLPYGQGLVTDNVIVWPSREGLYFARPEDGLPTTGAPNPWHAPFPNFLKNYFGNCSYADGVLVVVTPTQVWGYIAQSKKIAPRPDSTPRERFNWLADNAERAFLAGNTAAAMSAYREIATGELPLPFRAWAAARLLQWSPRAIALPPELMNEWILPPHGIPVTLEAFLQQTLGQSPLPTSTPVATCANQPCVPGLNASSDFDSTLKLSGLSPLRGVAGSPVLQRRLFAAGLHKLVAIPLDQSAVSEHDAVDVFTHAADWRGGFVAVGPAAVAVYGVAKAPLWVFRLPTTERLPNGSCPFCLRMEADVDCPPLSSFVLAGSWLLARIGEYHIIALDLHARRVVWVLGTTGRSGYESLIYASTPRLGPYFAVAGKYVIAQLSDGRRWFIALETGRPVTLPALGEHTARVNWPHSPTEVGTNRLALADGSGMVRLVQLDGRVKWIYEVEYEEGLTGDPPQVRAWGEFLLVAVRRNHGVEIDCVNATDGKRVWIDGPAFADADRINLFASDADADRVYIPTANKLLAVLCDGKTAWSADLPDTHGTGGWIVRAGASCIIAYPARAIPSESVSLVIARLTQSFWREPDLSRLPGLAATLYDAWVDRVVPVLLFAPETGKQLARFDIPARGPAVSAWFDANNAVFATGDRVVWLK